MRVLHVLGCKLNTKPNASVLEQINSLNSLCEVDTFVYFTGSIFNYFKAAVNLFLKMRDNHYDIVHAHFSRSCLLSMIYCKSIVVSYMGTDVVGNSILNKFIYKFINLFPIHKIYKSKRMLLHNKIPDNVHIIPNGVDFEKFFPVDRSLSRDTLQLNHSTKYILFLADPRRAEKNFSLAKQAFDIFQNRYEKNSELLVVYNIPHDQVLYYLNACDTLLLTSYYEGSPNVIKEAIVCNIPIVSTDVGDVSEIVGNIPGCFICKHDSESLSHALSMSVFTGRINGREHVKNLDINHIAMRIYNIYEQILSSKSS